LENYTSADFDRCMAFNLGEWKQVCATKGSAGVDGMEPGDFPDFHANLEKRRRSIRHPDSP
jgi:hypothetical protein